MAMAYASERARSEDRSLKVQTMPTIESLPKDTLLVVSHVLNELPGDALGRLVNLARQAGEVLWVEAGAHAESRRLIAEIRKTLLVDKTHHIVAPCTHSQPCGMLSAENTRHWCHSFAPVPSEAFQSAWWAEFARELGIDLRALPYSFLAMERADEPPDALPGFSRIIGRPREYKGYCKILSCQADGVRDLTLQKRDDPGLFRAIQKEKAPPTYRWITEGSKIKSGDSLSDSEEDEGAN